MNGIRKRLLAMLLCAAMCVSLLPAPAYAADAAVNGVSVEECAEEEGTILWEETPADEETTAADGEASLPEIQSVQAEGTDQKRETIPSEKTEESVSYPTLMLERETAVTISMEDETAFFQFTPTETGTYQFYSLPDADTYGYLYDSEMNLITENDDGEDGRSFMIRYDLTAGTTYILGARYYSAEETGTFSVVIRQEIHVPGEAEIENETEATCTEDGSYEEVIYCTDCGQELSRKLVVVEKLGHMPGESAEENYQDPTHTEKGSYDEVTYCTVCGEEVSRETIQIDALKPFVDLEVNHIEASAAEDGSGDVYVVVYYSLSEEDYAAITDPRLEISWTENGVLQADSMICSGGELIDCTESWASWRLFGREGTASFCLETTENSEMKLNATFFFSIDDEEEGVEFRTAEFTAEHFDASFSYDNAEMVTVEGYAPAGAEIQLYLDQIWVASVIAEEDGAFIWDFVVEDWKLGITHNFQAECEVNGHIYSKSESFYRKATRPVMVGMKYYDYVGAEDYVDIYAAMQRGETAAICYAGNDDPFCVVVEYSHPEMIESVFVTATIDGLRYSLEAVYDSTLNAFVAEGYFIEGNKRVSPSAICVEYTPVGSTRVVDESIDLSADSDLFSVVANSFPNATVEKDEESTTEISIYHVDLEYDGTEEDLVNTAFEYTVKALDYATGLEMYETYKNDTRFLSYIVPGLDEDRYYVNLDLSDPDTIRVLVVDTTDTVNGAAEYFISCLDTSFDTIEEQKKYVQWTEVADKIGNVTSIVDILGDMYDIAKDTQDLKTEITNAAYLTDEQKEIALQRADELNSDKLAFTILATALPLIVGTGGMATPVVMFSSLIWIMETLSDSLYEQRAMRIKTDDLNADWSKNTGEVTAVDEDGLTYHANYYLELEPNGHNYMYQMHIQEILVSGSGVSEPSSHALRKALLEVETGDIDCYFGEVKRVEYCDGVTGINMIVSPAEMACSGYYKATKYVLASTVTSVKINSIFAQGGSDYLFSAGPIGSGSDVEFAWTEIPEKFFEYSALDRIDLSSVTAIGAWAFAGCNLKSVSIPAEVKSIGEEAFSGGITDLTLSPGLESIGERAFACCDITQVTIPGTIIEFGREAFANCEKLTTVVFSEGVSEVGEKAFYNCPLLEHLTIPASLKKFGKDAFTDCISLNSAGGPGSGCNIEFMWDSFIPIRAFCSFNALTHVTIPGSISIIGEQAFENCDSLTSVTIEDGVTRIVKSAFAYCGYLTNVVIPSSVTEIGDGAFCGCSSLENLVLPPNLTSISSELFDNSGLKSIIIPDNVTEIKRYAFEGCESLSSVTLPSNLIEIGYQGFANCISLTSVTIPNGVTDLGGEIFLGCTNLTNVTIPDTVTEIGIEAFSGCAKLTDVILPDSVESIGNGAFSGCSSMTSITWPREAGDIGWSTFAGCTNLKEVIIPDTVTKIYGEAFLGCSSLTSVTIPDSVTEIGSSTFADCTALTGIALPLDLASIDYTCFSGCSSLTSVSIPDNVKTIYRGAFSGCSSLTAITIPDGVTWIGNEVFSGCSKLTKITIPNCVTDIGDGAFSGCSSLKEIVFEGPAPKFGGDVYYHGEDVFYGVTATAYYPEDDSSWTKSVCKDYGGKITWKPYSTESEEFSLNKSSIALICGKSETLKVSGNAAVLWSSEDNSVAAVNGRGKVTGKKAGKTTITASSTDGNYSASCVITVLFTDVIDNTRSFYEPVYWALENGITTGTSKTTFSPSNSCTRAQIVTFLWRLKGCPEPSSLESPFTDVTNPRASYYKPVLWALENGITTGTSKTTFSPDKACTRAQCVTFLWRALGCPEPSTEKSPFKDVTKPSSSFYKPVLWALENGITTGTSKTTFSPNNTCTRGQIVTFLYRYNNLSH